MRKGTTDEHGAISPSITETPNFKNAEQLMFIILAGLIKQQNRVKTCHFYLNNPACFEHFLTF
jgi:hypothetical protein